MMQNGSIARVLSFAQAQVLLIGRLRRGRGLGLSLKVKSPQCRMVESARRLLLTGSAQVPPGMVGSAAKDL